MEYKDIIGAIKTPINKIKLSIKLPKQDTPKDDANKTLNKIKLSKQYTDVSKAQIGPQSGLHNPDMSIDDVIIHPMTYDEMVQRVENKGCQLICSREDFEANFTDLHDEISIVSKCGHHTKVPYYNFNKSGIGIMCKECIVRKNTIKDSILQEYRVMKGLQQFCSQRLEIRILGECTSADLVYRPCGETGDRWMPLQIKTTQKAGPSGSYAFRFVHGYKDMYIILFCIEDQRIWLMDAKDVKYPTGVAIGRLNSHRYAKFEISTSELIQNLLDRYNHDNGYHRTFSQLNVPVNRLAQQEKEYREFRETVCNGLHFEYPEINGRVFDTVVNQVYKVQDKVTHATNTTSGMFTKRRKICPILYSLGDNDFYWIHMADKSGAYIVPEAILLEHGLINTTNYVQEHTSLSCPWISQHFYSYTTDMKKIEALFVANNKPTVVVNDYVPLVITNNPRPIRLKVVNHCVGCGIEIKRERVPDVTHVVTNSDMVIKNHQLNNC